MGAHTVAYQQSGQFSHHARCRCGWVTKENRTKQDAEDQVRRHEAEVERTRTRLYYGRTPSMASTRDYYRKMSEDPNVSENDRKMWKVLADELSKRVPDDGPDDAQPTLI